MNQSCPQPGCTFPEGGCIEGFSAPEQECSHLRSATSRASAVLDALSEASAKPVEAKPEEALARHQLHRGEALDANEVFAILRSSLARVVVIAGAADSGKTTLLASIYEQFQAGPFAGYAFAGSRSLLGFEVRCFKARLTSEAPHPDTERTKGSERNHFLHLDVARNDGAGLVTTLLMSDLPGEFFRLARDSEQECRAITSLSRADHVALLIDGERLTKHEDRITAYDDARLLLRGLVESRMIGKSTIVGVLFTKWDLVQKSNESDQTISYVDHIQHELTERFATSVAAINFHRITARDEQTGEAKGLDEVVRSWIEVSELFSVSTASHSVQALGSEKLESEYDRYLDRIRV